MHRGRSRHARGVAGDVSSDRDRQSSDLERTRDIVAEADSALGALVSYDVTAIDAVDGPLPVECSPSAAPGAPVLFPLNQATTVTCTATDSAHQTTTRTFVVQVRDTVAPVLCGLSDVSALATSELGAPLAFPTCANDQVDGAVAVTCDHASGSTFPFGTTLVTCTATDRSGNQSQGSFHAQITVGWSNFLSPIDVLNLVSFLRLLPVTVQFQLTGPSAGITDLTARLFIAPVDSQGNAGAERPASGGGGSATCSDSSRCSGGTSCRSAPAASPPASGNCASIWAMA